MLTQHALIAVHVFTDVNFEGAILMSGVVCQNSSDTAASEARKNEHF